MSEQIKRVFSQAVEDYLKAIYEIQEDQETVSTTVLAGHLNTSPAAVTKMVKHLAERKLVVHTPYYGVRLTPAGEAVALEVIRHHRLLELYLHEMLGYSWDEVDAEAERLEHHISEEFEARIDHLLDYPNTDPHGDPIPGPDGSISPPRGERLSEAEPGRRLVVRRVRDTDPEALRHLARIGLHIGADVTICANQPAGGPLTLTIGEARHTVGRDLAGQVFVETVRESGRVR